MSEVLNIEWRNLNASRRYPFADNCSLLSDFGLPLTDDVFLDGMFYPITDGEGLYLQSILMSQKEVYICDSSGYIAIAEITTSEVLTFKDEYDRVAGVLLKGPAFDALPVDMTFSSGATPFAPAVVAPQRSTVVRGFILPDGTVVTGSAVFTGERGVQVSSYMEGTLPVLRVDMVGDADSIAQTSCISCQYPLRCLKLHYVGGSGFLYASQTDNYIYLCGPPLSEVRMIKAWKNGMRPNPDGTIPPYVDSCPPPESSSSTSSSSSETSTYACPDPPEPKPPFIGVCPVDAYPEYWIISTCDSVGVTPCGQPNELCVSLKGVNC